MPSTAQDSSARDRYTYIPPAARQAMDHQAQAALPAHLRQYTGSSRPGYIPQKAQQELTAFMQKSMPAHLQQYAGAYVQQSFVDPGLRGSGSVPVSSAPTKPASVSPHRQSHSADIPAGQPDARFLNLFQSDAAPGKPSQPMVMAPGQTYQAPAQDQASPPPGTSHSQYDFILNPSQPAKTPRLLGGSSSVKRLFIALGSVAVLVVALALVSSLLGGNSTKTASLMNVLEEQTELVRVSTAGETITSDPDTQAFTYAVQLSVASAQQQLTTYMTQHNFKVNTKVLGLKHSTAVDTELQNAQTNNTYDSTITGVLQQDLNNYGQALKTAYAADPGPNGHKLLNSEYNGQQLLLQQSHQQSSP